MITMYLGLFIKFIEFQLFHLFKIISKFSPFYVKLKEAEKERKSVSFCIFQTVGSFFFALSVWHGFLLRERRRKGTKRKRREKFYQQQNEKQHLTDEKKPPHLLAEKLTKRKLTEPEADKRCHGFFFLKH